MTDLFVFKNTASLQSDINDFRELNAINAGMYDNLLRV